jgi:DNA-binding transcriptional ArsR family regulator
LDKKYLFDEAVLNYEKRRPNYGTELFKDIIKYAEITTQTHLSRPAVSHHLKILKEADIVHVRKVKTMNYYFLDPSSKIMNLKKLVDNIEELINGNGKEKEGELHGTNR